MVFNPRTAQHAPLPLTMRYDPRDPDAALVPVFRNDIVKNEAKSIVAGRPIYDDIEMVEIRFPGSRNTTVHPVDEVSHWVTDPYSGEQHTITYAERFAVQYEQFKSHAQQTKSGTPLDHLPFLTEAKRAELRALNIYTVEALEHIDGQELKNLGQGGRDLKNRAIEYLEQAKQMAPALQMQAELQSLRLYKQQLEDDIAALRDKVRDREREREEKVLGEGADMPHEPAYAAAPEEVNRRLVDELKKVRAANAELANASDALQRQLQDVAAAKASPGEMQFEQMSMEALREFIVAHTGHPPKGNSPRAVLIRLAADCAERARRGDAA